MINYDDMSDFDINSAVAAIVTGGDVIEKHDMAEAPTESGVQVIYKAGVHGEFLDYCNNASDAWTIIQQIWVELMSPPYRGYGTWWDNTVVRYNCGKLRAAMICFLKIKDAEK